MQTDPSVLTYNEVVVFLDAGCIGADEDMAFPGAGEELVPIVRSTSPRHACRISRAFGPRLAPSPLDPGNNFSS
jgi:hypothetical protein